MTRPLPDTRMSLILRLPGQADRDAWQEFVEIYEPFLYHFARRRGLQDSDALELVQEVFLGVTKSIDRWKPDPSRGQFRTWLFRIAKNQLLTHLRRRRDTTCDSAAWTALPDRSESPTNNDSLAFESEVFRWASWRVQQQVQPHTWRAFWMTCVEGQAVNQVAEHLSLPRSAVYVAKSRVIRHLREHIALLESSDA